MKKKEYRVIISLMISLIIIFMVIIGVLSYSNDHTLYLKDLEGDSSVLSDVIVSGYLQDSYHGQKFTIKNGDIKSEFLYYDNINDINDIEQLSTRYAKSAEDEKYNYLYNYEYAISKDANRHVIYDENKVDVTKKTITTYCDKVDVSVQLRRMWVDYRKKGLPDKSDIKLKSDVYIESNKKEFQLIKKIIYYEDGGTSESNKTKGIEGKTKSYGNALTVTEDNQYFTILTDERYKGINGIYKVKEFKEWYLNERYFDKGRLNEGDSDCVNTVATFSLNENNISVLGLHIVNNKLVLVLMVDDVLVFRAYEPETGDMLGEVKVNDMDMSEGLLSYEWFINDNILSLDIITQKDRKSLKIVSIEVDEEISILHCVDDFLVEEQIIDDIRYIGSVNNKLIVLANLIDIDHLQKDKWLAPNHYILYSFDHRLNNNKLLYKGEIITDANEDKMKYRYLWGDDDHVDYESRRSINEFSVQGVK